LDGVLDFLNSKKMTDASTLDLIDDEDSDVEEGIDRQTRENLGLGLLDQWQIVEDP
jgi:periodic tryptophan protein 2